MSNNIDTVSRDLVIEVLKETGIIQDNDLGHLVIDEIYKIPQANNTTLTQKEKREHTYKVYDNRLKVITNRLNQLFDEAVPLRDEYYKIMAYFRTQKKRGHITEEEYQDKVSWFKYLGQFPTGTTKKYKKKQE